MEEAYWVHKIDRLWKEVLGVNNLNLTFDLNEWGPVLIVLGFMGVLLAIAIGGKSGGGEGS